ncbi:survival protein sure-like phosphatase/nucleotidase [Mycena polygramma]|nr:survival protein sure-like phosphatase/nucleotidase [Mycena polygramma]
MKVLLTNDDGPPDSTTSPFIFAFYHRLVALGLGSQSSCYPVPRNHWIGKAFHITEVTEGRYFYPKGPGTRETSATSRPLKDGEVAEWILLDGTPATCANVGLHNIYPGEIDLFVPGPNFGRNVPAFALSSGTVGAALSASLSKTRSIAVSYGTVVHPTPSTYFRPADQLASEIILRLWNNWGADSGGLRGGEVDLYNVNIPLIEDLLTGEGLKIIWTTMWRNSYGRLFKAVPTATPGEAPESAGVAGPDALATGAREVSSTSTGNALAFKFSPAMEGLIHPDESSLPVGSDGWAMFKGFASVTPLRSSFAEPPETIDIDDRVWKMKL